MGGETNLSVLLANLTPRIARQYIFCSVPDHLVSRLWNQSIATFKEREGTTVVVEKEAAEKAGLSGSVQTMITLDIHSSLEVVGLISAVSGALARAGISVNIFSAFYHDHLFVPASRADEAIAVLKRLSGGQSDER